MAGWSAALGVVLLALLAGCSSMSGDYGDVSHLPRDTGGEHLGFPKGVTAAPYGFYLYLPSGYQDSDDDYPLLVFLHGYGERGMVLERLLRHGPPRLIDERKWHPRYPMIVASPQYTEQDRYWNPDRVHEFIRFVIQNYRINRRRVYVTGISMGGYGTFAYAARGKNSYAAAAIPICGGGERSMAAGIAYIPVWAFHGAADDVVPVVNSITMVRAINETQPEVKARLTIYPNVEHDSWTMTYDGTGRGRGNREFDPYDMDIYDWLLQYRRADPPER